MLGKIYHGFILSLIAVCFISCSNQQPQQKASPAMESSEAAQEGIKIEMASLASSEDLVCGMSLNEGIGDTASYNEKLYGFCSSGCKEDFLKEPGKYIK